MHAKGLRMEIEHDGRTFISEYTAKAEGYASIRTRVQYEGFVETLFFGNVSNSEPWQVVLCTVEGFQDRRGGVSDLISEIYGPKEGYDGNARKMMEVDAKLLTNLVEGVTGAFIRGIEAIKAEDL